MMARRRRRSVGGLFLAMSAAVALLSTVACQVILGIEERSEPFRDGLDSETGVDPFPNDAADGQVDAAASDGAQPPSPCNAYERDCNGACIELAKNNEHCGACNHSCGAASTCTSGLCKPELLNANVFGMIVAVDNKEVFYRVHGDPAAALSPMMARNKVTGAERTIGTVGRYHSAIVDGDDLVVLDNPDQPRIRRVNRFDGGAQVLYEQAASQPTFVHHVIDGDDIYFTTRNDIRKVKKDGSGYRVLATITEEQFGADDIVFGPNEIFFGIATMPGLWSMPKAGATPSTNRMASPGVTSSIEKIGDKIYWFGGHKLNVFDPSADSGAPVPLTIEVAGVAHSMAAKPPYLYVYDDQFKNPDSYKARILRINVDTREVLILANGIGDGRLVVDDTHVYYAEYYGGLYRIPR